MSGSGGKADHVEQRAAADGDEIGVAVDVEAVDLRMDFGDVEIGIFGALAAFDNDWRTDQMQAGAPGGEIEFNVFCQFWLGDRERFVEHDQSFNACAAFAGEHVFEERVIRREHLMREVHAVLEADFDCALDGRHVLLRCLVRRSGARFY
jgi:hypothetical protein